MPFTTPWRSYLSGDMFYGFSGARGKLVEQLTGRNTMAFAKAGTVGWLDQLLTPTAQNDVATLNDDFAAFMRSRPKWAEVVQNGDSVELPSSADDEVNNSRWRKKSKAGLEFLVKHHHFVHFAIDHGMDWTQVVSKPDAGMVQMPWKEERIEFKVPEGKLRTITYAEIRFAYRNRTDPDFQKRLQFWWQDETGRFEAGPPPWVKDSQTWNGYKPAREDGEDS